MILKKVTLCNFKNFRGKQTIDFTHNTLNRKNIILIGGANGAGKTTLVDAIRLCLFGKHFNGYTGYTSNYPNYILSSKNRTSKKKKDTNYFIQVEIELNETFPPYSLHIKREWKPNKEKIQEKFTITRDGTLLEIIPREYWEDYIISLIPPFVSDYFFFDGERVKELATGNKAEETLRQSIRDLIGLNIYENLYTDLEKLKKKIRHRNITQDKIKEELTKKEGDLSQIKKKTQQIAKEISVKSEKKDIISAEQKEIEEKLRRTAGEYAKTRKKDEENVLKRREKIATLENDIKQICGEILPFIISSKVCKDLLYQLGEERQIKEINVRKNLVKETIHDLQKRIGDSKLFKEIPQKDLKIVTKELKKINTEMLNELTQKSKVSLLHDLSSTETHTIEDFLISTEKDFKNNLNALLTEREKILLEIKKITEKINKVPDEGFIKEYIDVISGHKTMITQLGDEINNLFEKKSKLDSEVQQKNEEIRQMEETIVLMEEDNKKIETSLKIQDIIQEYSDKIVASQVKELEKKIMEMYRKLANKDDMINRIVINKKSFATQLFDNEKNSIHKETISAGEKEIYALSILWGLSQISDRKLPLVIDSPLAKLDSTHVNNIITSFFPNAGEQVIILSHDREIDSKNYQKLKPYVNKTYILLLSTEEKKIQKGYFTKGKKDGK